MKKTYDSKFKSRVALVDRLVLYDCLRGSDR
jgi:hypothetical protein